jgi:hypothetical protein
MLDGSLIEIPKTILDKLFSIIVDLNNLSPPASSVGKQKGGKYASL